MANCRSVFFIICWISCLGLLFNRTALAEEAKLLVSEKPYYTDVPIDLQVSAEGFEEDPPPTIQVAPPQQGQLDFVGVSPSVSSSIQIINGRMTQWKSVVFKFQYRFTTHQQGNVTVGPFIVRQGDKEAVTQRITFKIGEIPTSDAQRIQLLLPKTPLMIGQRLPIRLEWWIHPDSVENLVQQEAQVPLFQMIDAFRFVDDTEKESRNAMIIQTPSGPMKFPATTRREDWKGESYLVLTVKRLLIPLKAGEYTIPPASMTLEEAVRWQRTLFGQRTATHVRKVRVQDQAQTLTVRPLPTQGRPASFAGAIGPGFSLEVVAQRTVLQAGDPIRLTLTLRGDSVATASLPRLDVGGGLSSQDFRVPEGENTGIIQEGAKQFDVTVRVLHAGVKEIPPIAYSWFDPELGSYQTTHSRPIALSVGASQVVSAGDVVRTPAASTEQQQAEKTPETNRTETQADSKTAPTFTLMGADLSIEQDPNTLLHGRTPWLASRMVQWLCYLLGLLLIGLAIVWRRKADGDPVIIARQKALKQGLNRIEKAGSVQEMADALRQMAAQVMGLPRQELDALLEACDNLIFAPGAQQGGMDKGLQSRAVHLARRMMENKA